MNGVIGMTDLTLASDLTPEQRQDLQTVKESAESLLKLLNEVLDFSKIEAGKLELETISFSLRHVLDLASRPLAILAHGKGLAFRCEAAPDVPDAVMGDPERLRQILVNLIGNAVKFTERGEVRVTVERLAAEAGHVDLQFTVADTGIGVPADKRVTIFEPFAQADGSTTRRFGGTGLGLTISARLAKMLQGQIRLDSEVGKGSRFYFTARFALRADSEAKDSRKLNILLADDNPVNRKLMTFLLGKHGHSVALAGNGREVLDTAAAQRFDLILMDVQMPGIDGLEAAALLRQREQSGGGRTPIIALTAMTGDRERCLEAGMDGYLTKPINEGALLTEIAERTRRHAT
jgi:CheY-like chemotaxis protein